MCSFGSTVEFDRTSKQNLALTNVLRVIVAVRLITQVEIFTVNLSDTDQPVSPRLLAT
jgi:hypothetical protein